MKLSQYNFILYTDTHAYWYNTLTHSFFRLTKELGRKIEHLSGDLDGLRDALPAYFDKLVNSGFVVDDDFDELEAVRKHHSDNVNKKDYFLIVLPTLNCNYSCWYCIQDHIPSLMSEATMEAIKRHIEYMIDVEKIDSLRLEWFGGEPFMFFDRVIEPLSRYAIELCEKRGVSFINSATTNGYFIMPKISGKLKELKFKQFQITLDGEKQFHDKVKFTKNCDSTFEHVLRNINDILASNDEASIILRINYTHETFTPNIVEQVNQFISSDVRKRVCIVPKKVWQENVDKDFSPVITEILDLFSQSGYFVQRWNPNMDYMPCYVNGKYYNTISYNGHVHKCTACDDLYDPNPRGILKPDGTIEWKDGFDEKCTQPTFENERCLACKRLPVCMGLCPREFLGGKNYCKYDHVDEDFEASLLNYMIHEYD